MRKFKNAREEAVYFIELYDKQEEKRWEIIGNLLTEEYLQENNYRGLQKALYYFKYYAKVERVIYALLVTRPRTCLSDYEDMTKIAYPYFSKDYFISQARWYRIYNILKPELDRLNQAFISELRKNGLYPS